LLTETVCNRLTAMQAETAVQTKTTIQLVLQANKLSTHLVTQNIHSVNTKPVWQI